MTSSSRVTGFTEALLHLERTDDVTPLTEMFADEARLRRPEVDGPASDGTDVQQFWADYVAPFAEVRTEFTRIVESGDLAVLEWESRGELTTGRDITYRGATFLVFDTDNAVTELSTYFDTAAFLQPPSPSGDGDD